jgi:hypothetical protein
MSFLFPLFLVGLATLAIPVALHLIQKERKHVVHFPSLMFLQRIPYQSVRRRHIRHWFLLLMRLAALALIVAAFARPFLRRLPSIVSAAGGAREVVVLIDRSYSMGYGNHWAKAMDAARDAIAKLAPGDRASVVFFESDAEVTLRSTADKSRLDAAIATAKPGAGATRFGPALKLAGSILGESTLPRKEVVFISDFQRTGWQGAEGLRLPDGATVTPVSVAESASPNLAVTPVSLQRTPFSEQDRLTVTGGVLNHGADKVANLPVTLELDGHALETKQVSVEGHGCASVTFAPFTPPNKQSRATVRIGTDALEQDNVFHFVVSPKQPLRVVVADRPGATDSSLYLVRAFAFGDAPAFDVVVKPIDAVSADDIDRAAVVILNDVPVPQLTAERLAQFVQRGGGLLVAFGARATWPTGTADVLPAVPGMPVDRSKGQAARIGALEYGDALFEPFRQPRSGDFSSARFYGYRAVTVAPAGQTIARFDDGAPALLQRKVGTGRAAVWTSTLDLTWNDLAVKPVFLPFLHRLATTLAAYTDRPAWVTVGNVLPPVQQFGAAGGRRNAARTVLTPAGQRVTLDTEGSEVLQLSEQGFYEVRSADRGGAETALSIAANVDLSESNLAPMDTQELVAGATGRAGGAAAAGTNTTLTDEEQEHGQKVWWYLLFAGFVLLAAETAIANRLVV